MRKDGYSLVFEIWFLRLYLHFVKHGKICWNYIVEIWVVPCIADTIIHELFL